jgi:hypothetical protein
MEISKKASGVIFTPLVKRDVTFFESNKINVYKSTLEDAYRPIYFIFPQEYACIPALCCAVAHNCETNLVN